MNSFFENLGIYSYPIDCFLEMSRYIFQPAFFNLSVRSEFIDLLHNALSEYSNVSKQPAIIREPAFCRALAALLIADVYDYRNSEDKVIDKRLMLESTDFYLSQNGRLVTKTQSHQWRFDYTPLTRNNTMHMLNISYA